jgi:hypothetical protein
MYEAQLGVERLSVLPADLAAGTSQRGVAA